MGPALHIHFFQIFFEFHSGRKIWGRLGFFSQNNFFVAEVDQNRLKNKTKKRPLFTSDKKVFLLLDANATFLIALMLNCSNPLRSPRSKEAAW